MKTLKLKGLLLVAFALFTATSIFAQDAPKIKTAVNEAAAGKIGNTTIVINYGSPSLQGRKILGVKEPYGKAWRAGANQPTTIAVAGELTIDGHKLPVGLYSLYMVPGETEWKVIFNKAIPSWGVGRGGVANDAAQDLFSVTVKAKKAGPTEKLRYEVRKNGIALVWEDVEVFIPAK